LNKTNFSVLLVDDDRDVLESYAHLMAISGLTAKSIDDPTTAIQHIHADWAGVVLLDMYMPQMHGMALLEQIKAVDAGIPVIIITGHGDIPMAVSAVKLGACEFIEKPINPPSLLTQVKQHLDMRRGYIEQKQSVYKKIHKSLLGNSAQIEQIRQHVAQYALLNSHVIIWGEVASGRHSIAQLLHDMKQPEIEKLDVRLELGDDFELMSERLDTGFNGSLIISGLELLGEEKQRQLVQQLLLVERNCGRQISLISIFETDPEQLVAQQKLVPELFYLINQGCIKVPALRQRPDDIAPLFHYFLKQSCRKLSKILPKVDSAYLSILRAHQWHGNIRELRNVAELYAIGIVKLTGKDRLYNQETVGSPLDETVEEFEKQLIEDALYLHSGKVNDAACYLQIPRKKLYLRMKKHSIEKEAYKPI